MDEWVIFGWTVAELALLGYSFIGVISSKIAIQGNELYLPRRAHARGYIEGALRLGLAALRLGLASIVGYVLFVPHNPQAAVMSGIASEDFFTNFLGKGMHARMFPRALTTADDEDKRESIEKLRKELEYMSERDEI